MAAKFKAPSPPFIGARHYGGSQNPKAIVIHGTVSSDNPGTARNIADWWHGPGSPVTSAHYVVDPRETIQTVGDHSVAYHCGYNTGSIGIEFCDEQQGPANRWNDADSNAILRRAARLTAEICLAYGIEPVRPSIADLKRKGPHGIYGHNDSRLAFGHTSHSDPRDFPWEKFLRLVRAEIRAIKGEAQASAPKRRTGGLKDKMKADEYFIGARGPHVRWLADRLAAHGLDAFFKNGRDNFFSEGEDRAAVRAFQRSQGWRGADADGFPGPETLRRLAADPEPKKPEPGQHKKGRPKSAEVKFAHVSMQFSDTPAQMAEDAKVIFARGYDVITGTEAGHKVMRDVLHASADLNGYRFFVVRSVWVAVKRSLITGGWEHGFVPVIEAGESRTGKHSDRGIAWVSFDTANLGHITVGSGHYLTKGRPVRNELYSRNLDLNERFGPAIETWAHEHGKGSDLVFYAGDQNIVDRVTDTFFGAPMTSAWDELKHYESTGHGNIDVVASYDEDGRVKAESVRALDDHEVRLHTDHFLVEAVYDIRHLA